MIWVLYSLIALVGGIVLAAGPVMVDRSEGKACGHWKAGERRRVLLSKVQPRGDWWDRLLCRVHHQTACCPDHATWVHRRELEGFSVGMLCERCGCVLGNEETP